MAEDNAPDLLPDAEVTSDKFREAFRLFALCHLVYDSAYLLAEETIDELGTCTCNSMLCYIKTSIQDISFFPPEQNIQSFLEFYRERFNASFTPKLHILEDHVVPFLRKWRVGFGFHGEQGAESLHASFNKIGESYVAIPDAVKRLQCVMREHHLQVSPTMLAQQPAVKKRRTL